MGAVFSAAAALLAFIAAKALGIMPKDQNKAA
jgi:hypothetical protein